MRTKAKKTSARATKTEKLQPPIMPLFPDVVPKGYTRVKEHLRRLTKKKRSR